MAKLCNIPHVLRDRKSRIVYIIVCRKNGPIYIGNNRRRSPFHRWGCGFSNIKTRAYPSQTDWYPFNPNHRSECILDIYWYNVENNPNAVASALDGTLAPSVGKKTLMGKEKLKKFNEYERMEAEALLKEFLSESGYKHKRRRKTKRRIAK